jgi:hypothetical protein
VTGLVVFLGPIFYQKYLKHTEHANLFMFSQIIAVIQGFIQIWQALRLNGYVSDLFLFVVITVFATVLERTLTMIPSFIIMAKVIPPGVEGTMVSIFTTIINLN